MKRADLRVGDRVWVVLAYDGGRGWATILDLDAEPERFAPKTATIEVQFEPGHTARGIRTVTSSRIVKKAAA